MSNQAQYTSYQQRREWGTSEGYQEWLAWTIGIGALAGGIVAGLARPVISGIGRLATTAAVAAIGFLTVIARGAQSEFEVARAQDEIRASQIHAFTASIQRDFIDPVAPHFIQANVVARQPRSLEGDIDDFAPTLVQNIVVARRRDQRVTPVDIDVQGPAAVEPLLVARRPPQVSPINLVRTSQQTVGNLVVAQERPRPRTAQSVINQFAPGAISANVLVQSRRRF